MYIFTNKTIPQQPPELEFGNKEYKTVIVYKYKKRNPNISYKNYIENKSTQMLYRLIEGNGKAIYMLGIRDDGKIWGMTKEEMENTVSNLKSMSKMIKAEIKSIRVYKGGRGYVCSVRIFLNENEFKNKIKNSIV
tara:strand:- start:110 stop:514 length:405 start_codon:yes stop_codon:yes gene_type:complete